MSIKNVPDRAVKRRKTSHGSGDKAAVQLNASGKSPGTIQNALPNSTVSASSSTKSGLLAIQANELISTVRAEYASSAQVAKPLLSQIVDCIKSIPNGTPQSWASVEKSFTKLKIAIPSVPYPHASEVKYQFQYEIPSSIDVSDVSTSSTKSSGASIAEISVQMPSSLFQDKDYLNSRALHKRAHYLACLAFKLREDLGSDFSCRYFFQDGNNFVPVLELAPKSRGSDLRIIINVTFPPEVGPIEKCLPEKNCLRAMAVSTPSGLALLPTPFYNSTIRTLSSASTIRRLIQDTTKACEAYKDVCLLGEIWLRQRGFTSSSNGGGFGGHEWSIMCALLLTAGGHKDNPLFSPRYSSIQLFKAMLQVLSGRNLVDQPMYLRLNGIETEQASYPVFFDGSTGFNVLYKMTAWSYRSLIHHSQLSLNAANARLKDNFESLFTLKVAESYLDFDEIWSLDISGLEDGQSPIKAEKLEQLYKIIERGLGDRVAAFTVKQPDQPAWNLTKTQPKYSGSSRIDLCLHTNPANAGRTIDHGPSAEEQEEARDFRQFWGDKSELRRFRDGRITETLVWSPETSITLQIIQYLMAYHFKISPSSITPKHHDLAQTMLDDGVLGKASDAFDLIYSKYQELSSKLHQLEGLPLPIRAVSPADSALRSARANHPLSPATAQPIDTLIQFDSSTRWPDNLAAIQHTKIAFLAKVSELLTEADSALETRMGIENAETSATGYLNTSFLDIAYASPTPGMTPIVFRLRIHHDREHHLLQSLLSSATGPTKEFLTTALALYKRTFLASPAHTTAIRTLTTQFPTLSPTIRLLKKWAASHHLSNHIALETLELIAAQVHLSPFPWSTPGSTTTAFFRCLHLLSHWDWTSTPLKIDLSSTSDGLATPESHRDLETRFAAWRKLDPAMNNVAWFIGSNIDGTGTVWTSGARPPRVVAGRITALARAAMNFLHTSGVNADDAGSEQQAVSSLDDLFASPLSDFDFVFHLKKSVVRGVSSTHSKSSKTSTSVFKNLQLQRDLAVTDLEHVVARDVVALYLSDLESTFGNAVLFFHGGVEGGDRVVAGLWRPGVAGKPREWRVRLGWSSVLVNDGDGDEDKGEGDEVKCVVNKEGMLADMAMLGEGMIEKITIKEV